MERALSPRARSAAGAAALAVAAFAGGACRPSGPAELRVDRSRAMVVTVVHAELAPSKPAGDAWDAAEAELDYRPLLGLLGKGLSVLLGGTDLAILGLGASAVAGLLPGPGEDTARSGPDAFVRMDYAGARRVTPLAFETVRPSWHYPLLVDLPAEVDLVTLAVIDADGSEAGVLDDPVGTITIPARDLRRPGVRRLGPFGGVTVLELKVEKYSRLFESSANALSVPADRRWTETGLNVIEGQLVHFTAAGKICVTRDLFRKEEVRCVGPGGVPGRFPAYNVIDAPHGALLAKIGEHGPPALVGAGPTTLVANGSGALWVGPNDTDVGNNSDSFTVSVTVR